MSPSQDTYDIIFAGGGAAACVTAGRLAMSDPSLKILILEAGPHSLDVPAHTQPGRFLRNIYGGVGCTYHVSLPSDKVAGRSLLVPSGRCLGGGSAVNFMIYTRAAKSDYDDWETVYDNKGWGSKDIIPLLKRAETYEVDHLPNDTHGTNGPIKVSFAKSHINIHEDYMKVVREIDDRGITDDVNDMHHSNQYGLIPRYIDGTRGRRSDAAHGYIYSQESNTNLKILDRKRVVRVVFEGTRAVGVEYVDDVTARAKEETTTTIALASRLVVLSAGAFGSPAILERSGIGAAEILKKNDIKQLVDLPGVGENYMDHNLMSPPVFAAEGADSMDKLFWGSEDDVETFVPSWKETGHGLLAHNGHDVANKYRPNAAELESLGPKFQEKWQSYFANAPDKCLFVTGLMAGNVLNPTAPREAYYAPSYYLAYPLSRGNVHITGGLDPYAKQDFQCGILSNDLDLPPLRLAYKKTREIMRRIKFFRGELPPSHPEFPAGSKAAIPSSKEPVAISAPDIMYTAEDDAIIDEYHRKNVQTTWHSIGTCGMKPREKGGVVDSRLNVYGVQNLKVADCSIAPDNVSCNTYNTALAIGEKAADIIAEELGIKI